MKYKASYINPDVRGGYIVRTIKSSQYKVSLANFLLGTSRGATGVMLKIEI